MRNILILLFFFSYIATAQTTLFNKSIELNPDIQHEVANSILVDDNGDIIVIGKTRNRYEEQTDSLAIIKIDYYGNYKWKKTYNINPIGEEYVKESVLLEDNSFVIGGTAQYNNTNNNAFLLKLDSLGNIIWYQEYGDEYYQSIYDLKSTLDGGFIFGRRTNSPDIVVGDYDGWVVKTDSLGNVEWEVTLGDELWYSTQFIAVLDTSYSILVAGSDGDLGSGLSKVYTLNLEGEIINENILEGNFWVGLSYGLITKDKGNLVSSIVLESPPSNTKYNGYLFKLDSLGNMEWDIEISNGIDAQEWLYKGVQLSDGSYMICGSTYHNQNLEVGEASSWRGWLVKVSEEGELLWSKVFRHDEDNYFEYFEDIALHPDGSVVIVGFTGQAPEEGQLGTTRNNMWVLKVDQDGNDWLPLTVEVTSSDMLFCVGDTVDLSTFVYNGKWCAYSNGENCPYNGWWTGSGTTYLSDSLSPTPYFAPNTGGIYDLTYHIVDQAGDTASISTANLIVFNRTELTGLDNDTVYIGDSLNIIPQLVDINSPYFGYEWSGNGTAYLEDLTDTTTFIAQDSGVYELNFYYEFGSDCSDTKSFEIVVIDTLTTSLSNLAVSPIKAYPNPAKEKITFEYPALKEKTTLQIYDTWGQLISETILPISSEKYTFILKEINAGVYFYKIGAGQRGKFIVLRE